MKEKDIAEVKKQIQPALAISEQIENLKGLGLLIDDESPAADFLNDVSYYRFIKGYSLGLKSKNGNYYENVSFEQLAQLYLFNANFRQLLFPQIEKIEINLRCRISNHFSLEHGALGYLDSQNFSKYPEQFEKEIYDEINRNWRSPFIQNFRKNYECGSIPFYAVVEIFSFGTLSKFFKNMLPVDKKAVAKTFGVNYNYLESWIENIAYVRNVCAHYGRLYNAKLPKKPALYQEDKSRGVVEDHIMGTLVCMKHLLAHDRHWDEFVNTIELLFEKYPAVRKETMGFTENWKDILT
ncbi:MAG: Abi family protein [Oscillospiraceae bacterium]|nr:Abi family protein [Oscillospiraceae bacterium]